jgi:hypothetical protein
VELIVVGLVVRVGRGLSAAMGSYAHFSCDCAPVNYHWRGARPPGLLPLPRVAAFGIRVGGTRRRPPLAIGSRPHA